MIHLGIRVIAFFDHHVLNHGPLQHYTALACTCKEAHALLSKPLQQHRWKTFKPEFHKQLDFVDMFIMTNNLNLNADTSTVFIPRAPGSLIFASVRRDWDFVRGVVTVTVQSIEQRLPGTEYRRVMIPEMITDRNFASEEDMWKKGRWEFSYQYNKTLDCLANYCTIHAQMKSSLALHVQSCRAIAATQALSAACTRYYTFAAIGAALGIWTAYLLAVGI
jgi:hypothetical protein